MTYELRHGTWWERKRDVPPDQLMQGRFSRLFDPAVAPAAKFDLGDLQNLAREMTADLESPPTPEGDRDGEENSGLEAGYTYIGQFIDHDLTFDPTSQLRRVVDDLSKLVDFRTPRFDLDSLYGRGPSDQPYLYDGAKLLLGRKLSGNPHDPGASDLQRGPNGRALIGDPRNDENRIVAQLHATFIRFHNRMVELMPGAQFEDIQNQVRWHYQWAVVNDFLPAIINTDTVREIFPHLASGESIVNEPPVFVIDRLAAMAQPYGKMFMPVEFSVAAYRFGHSMIRPIYRINETIARRPIFSTSADASADLGGMRPIPDDWAIDWQFFFDLGQDAQPGAQATGDVIVRKPQLSYKIDTSLVNPLSQLPAVIATNPPSLPERNLIRGNDFGLPSGQTVAGLLGVAVLDDSEVLIGKATTEDQRKLITDISMAFAGNAPLWAYVLAEAQATSWAAAKGTPTDDTPIRLGPVGGHLVGEVFAALLYADPTSYVNADEPFSPRADLSTNGQFGFVELIKAALASV